MGLEQKIKKLVAGNKDPFRHAKKWKDGQNGKVIGHILPDVPEEIIHAANFLPIPIMNMANEISLSQNHLPSFLCSVVKGPFELALQGALDFIDGMVIPYVCDTTRAFSQVWQANYPKLFNHTLWLPKKLENKSAKNFLVKEFKRLHQNIEVLAEREVTQRDLKRSISICNYNRQLLRELSVLTSQDKAPLTYGQYLGIVRAVMMMPKEKSNTILTDLLAEIRDYRGTNQENNFPKVFLFGMLCESPTILDAFTEAGLQIVDDNLYNGSRYFLNDVDESADAIVGLVNRHLSKDPLSTYHYQKDPWADYLTKILKEKNIDGFVFLTTKYCDPFEFDHPYIKKLLQEFEIPALFIETDHPSTSNAQIKTRLEAFGEILRGGI